MLLQIYWSLILFKNVTLNVVSQVIKSSISSPFLFSLCMSFLPTAPCFHGHPWKKVITPPFAAFFRDIFNLWYINIM